MTNTIIHIYTSIHTYACTYTHKEKLRNNTHTYIYTQTNTKQIVKYTDIYIFTHAYNETDIDTQTHRYTNIIHSNTHIYT